MKLTLHRFFIFHTGLVYFLIALGGTVRNLDAGLACPDWPLCHGRVLPPMDIQIFAEFFHRVVAGLAGFLTLGVAIYIASKKELRRVLGRLAILAVILLLGQVIMGGLTVLKLLQSEVVTLHLILGTLYFAVLLQATLRTYRYQTDPDFFNPRKGRKRAPPSGLFNWAIVALVVLFIQMIFGGTVSSNYAGLACPDFPTCLGMWWPGLEGLVGLHMFHRIGAILAFVAISIYLVKLEFSGTPRHLIWKGRAIACLLVLQIALGIGNVVYQLPISMSVAHLAIAEALFALILITAYEVRHFQLR
jgi:heme a synthase